MYLTKRQLEEIAQQIASISKKDSDFEETFELNGEDYVAIVQNGVNKKISGDVFRDELHNGPQGESAYEIAVRHGYVGTEEEWLNDPINGIKGVGIIDIEEQRSSVSSGDNLLTIRLSDGTEYLFRVKNGKGVSSIVQTQQGIGSDADNIYTVNYSEGPSTTLIAKNGSRGSSGFSGAAEDLELVTDLTAMLEGSDTAGITASLGKTLFEDYITDGYDFRGRAIYSSSPNAAHTGQKIFYYADTPGTYEHFDNIEIAAGEVCLLFYNTQWTKRVIGVCSSLMAPKSVYMSTGSHFNPDGSVVIGILYISEYEGGSLTEVTVNDTFEIPSNRNLVYNRFSGEFSVVVPSEVSVGDLLLLKRNSAGKFVGGYLYPSWVGYISAEKMNRSIYPVVERGSINALNGEFNKVWYHKRNWRTPRFICVNDMRVFSIALSITAEASIVWYDEDFAFISADEYQDLTADTPVSITVVSGAKYCKIRVRKDSGNTDVPKFTMKLTGLFPEVWDFANVRPSGGYQHLTIPINVADCASANNASGQLQDEENLQADYGLLALPEQYNNVGQPTRLIIFCHGSDTSYTEDTMAFPDKSVDPTYFLACGCAVMDIDGEVYHHTSEYKHNFSVESLQAYYAAYTWVVDNYNICKDGVFLGGRSMGATETLDLLTRTKIPIIAACSIAPSVLPLRSINYMTAEHREEFANRFGMVGTQPVWTDNRPMTTAEWNYFKDNWDRVYMWAPIFGMIVNIPDKDVFFDPVFNESVSSVAPTEAELALYGSMIAKLPVPYKIFVATNDPTCPPARNSDILHRMLINGGSYVEERKLPSGGHFPEYDDDLTVEIVDDYGNTITAPIVYAEMMQFWKRYEKWR